MDGHVVWYNHNAAQRSCSMNMGRNAAQHDANSPDSNLETGSDEKAGGKVSKDRKRCRPHRKKMNKHIRFDDDGNPMVATPSKVVAKARRFLHSVRVAESDASDTVHALDPYGVYSKQWQSVVDTDEAQESSDDDVIRSGKYWDAAGAGITRDGTKSKRGDADHSSTKAEMLETSLVGQSQSKPDLDSNTAHCAVRSAARVKKSQKKKRAKKKKRDIVAVPMPPEVAADATLAKYWAQRYRLFSKFDEGIRLDYGLFSCFVLCVCVCMHGCFVVCVQYLSCYISVYRCQVYVCVCVCMHACMHVCFVLHLCMWLCVHVWCFVCVILCIYVVLGVVCDFVYAIGVCVYVCCVCVYVCVCDSDHARCFLNQHPS